MTNVRSYGLSLLIALLIAIYTMTNAGRFHVIDEVSLFAVTESLALRGAVDTNAIAWTQWVNSPGEVLGAFGPDGDVFSKKGAAPALFAVPWYLTLRLFARLRFTVGLLQSTLLWNGVVTAGTAALLWLTATRLGYRERTGFALALLFGLATIAWPYANQFFGEPLSALSLLLILYGLVSWRQTERRRWLVAAGLGAGLAIATVTAHALLVVVFALYLAVSWWQNSSRQPDGRRAGALPAALALFAAPVLAAVALLGWYNAARFGNPLATGYHFDSGEGFTTPIWQGAWGLLISPYRGLFWHTPLLIAALFALPQFWRRHRLETLTIGALSGVLIGLYSMWWMWWGGYAWGPRFLVPLTPCWVLLLAPVVDQMVAQTVPDRVKGRWRRGLALLRGWGVSGLALIMLAALSFLVQISAVVVNYVNYETQLRTRYPTDWADPLKYGPPAQSLAAFGDSPVIGQWRLMADGLVVNSDLAWLWASGNVQWLVVLVGGAVLLTLGGATVLWWRSIRPDALPTRPGAMAWTVLMALPLLLIAVWSGEVSRTPHYGEAGVGYRAALADICAASDGKDAVITIAPFTYQIPMNWMAVDCRQNPPLFGYAKDSLNQPEAQAVLERLARTYDRLWLVTGGLPVNDPDNTIERWLADSAYKADDRWRDDYRIVRYATPRLIEGAPFSALNVPLVDDAGRRITVLAMRAPQAVVMGDILPVDIYYQLETEPASELRWFVQLIGPNGLAVALLDTAPRDGYAAFLALPAGEELVEHAGLQIPLSLTSGSYQLIAGLYDPAQEGAPRLKSPDGSGFVELGKITIVEPAP